MENNRRTQAARSAATRDALIGAGRALFADRGYAAVSAEEIVQAAGVTRGALYHQFADKTEVFAAVFETVEAELIERIGGALAEARLVDPIATMRLGAGIWLDVCGEPEIHRITLIDAPAVLGMARWREIGDRYSLALAQALLASAMALGRVAHQPVAPLAHVVMGAVREAALYLASASDPILARREVGAALDRLIQSLGVGEELT